MLTYQERKSIWPLPRPLWAFAGAFVLFQVSAYTATGLDWTRLSEIVSEYGHDHNLSSGFTFDDRMWVVGMAGYSAEAYSSGDGESWAQMTLPAPTTDLYPVGLSYNGKIWISYFEWSSPDGILWKKTPYPPYGPFADNAIMAGFNGRLWSLGGTVGSGGEDGMVAVSTVRSSPDAQSPWSRYEAPWPGRCGHSAVVFNGKLWIMGGETPNPANLTIWYPFNDVWFTEDGQNWSQAATPPWPARAGHATVVAEGKMWVLGGWAGNLGSLNDVWCTSDGSHWTQVTAAAPWSPRSGFASVVFQNKIWVMGGRPTPALPPSTGAPVSDVWYSDILTAAIDPGGGPASGWYQVGQSLDLTAIATGLDDALTYQWYKDGKIITDATDALYHVYQLVPSDTGAYSCQVAGSDKAAVTAGPVQISVFDGKLPVGGFAALIVALLIGFLYLTRMRGAAEKRAGALSTERRP